MFNKLVFSLIAMAMVATNGFASPLTDFSQGKTSVDITWRPSVSINDKYDGYSDNYDSKKATFDWRITSGLGDNWAVQYNQYNAIANPDDYDAGVRTQELNVLYKLDKNTAVFAGYHRAKFNYSSDWSAISTPAKNTLQVGLVGTAEIAMKTNIYGMVGFGKDLANYEAGISYEVAKNTELYVNYRYKKVKSLSNSFEDLFYGGVTEYRDDVTTKGFGYGVTFKF